jgi:glycosyltransferase involved in cell wall biosynthesis
VSVIVPVLNGAAHVGRCLDALCAQTYPPERFEILVVDNGSDDETRGVVRRYAVRLLVERSARSPYLARNTGLAHASGDVLAFTDADCVPAKSWIEQGVERIEQEGADLAGGRVEFALSAPPRAAELLDAVKNLDNERSIAERGVAKTGNLFVARRVFDELGGFAADRRSGGDVEFTARASGAGFSLVYAPAAVVTKPARRALALARKQYRVGRGEALLWRERGVRAREIAGRSLRSLRPVRPDYVRERLRARGPAGSEARWPRVWLAAWGIGAVQGLGRLRGWLGAGAGR